MRSRASGIGPGGGVLNPLLTSEDAVLGGVRAEAAIGRRVLRRHRSQRTQVEDEAWAYPSTLLVNQNDLSAAWRRTALLAVPPAARYAAPKPTVRFVVERGQKYFS